MLLGIPKENTIGEKRVSVVPEAVSRLKGVSLALEQGAARPRVLPTRLIQVKGCPSSTPQRCISSRILSSKYSHPLRKKRACSRRGRHLVSFLYPLAHIEAVRILAARRVTAFAMELMPRISRAQSMDALSSQAMVSGYKAVLLAADAFPKFFPMLMTAAGTIPPARVFVIGAGVAGLQAIAVARRMGAVVEAYDVRPCRQGADRRVWELNSSSCLSRLKTRRRRAAMPGPNRKSFIANSSNFWPNALGRLT